MSVKVPMKFIATDSAQISNIEITSGQVIFSRDNHTIYLDTGNTRTEYKSIISIPSEQARIAMVSPVAGYYFVEDTSILWSWNSTSGWIQITYPPSESVVFEPYAQFPQVGQTNVLYVDNDTMYVWDSTEQEYVLVNAQKWEEFYLDQE